MLSSDTQQTDLKKDDLPLADMVDNDAAGIDASFRLSESARQKR
jgi:hypothetical protein